MKLKDFIEALTEAGWEATSDAQHEGIKSLHEQIFPVVSGLEEDVQDLLSEIHWLQTGERY